MLCGSVRETDFISTMVPLDRVHPSVALFHVLATEDIKSLKCNLSFTASSNCNIVVLYSENYKNILLPDANHCRLRLN